PKTEAPKTENAETTAEEPTPLSRLEHVRQSLGAEHPDTLAAWRDYTTSLMADKRYAEARPQLGKLVAACEKVFGDKDPVTVNNRADWARCFAETTLYEPALEQYTTVAVRREELLGKQDPATLDARYSVVECLLALQRDVDATELLGPVVADCRAGLGDTDERTLLAWGKWVQLLEDQSRYEEALHQYKELSAHRQAATSAGGGHGSGSVGERVDELIAETQRVCGPYVARTRRTLEEADDRYQVSKKLRTFGSLMQDKWRSRRQGE
ncbi:MAG: tetratricopeptide repeat protein, partial [Corynebacterium matruchotii]